VAVLRPKLAENRRDAQQLLDVGGHV
jgi:hypothetical protein